MAGSIREVELLRRPTDFRRMVSWELSEVKERVKKKKKRKKSQVSDGQLLEPELSCTSSEDDELYSSEEDEFYSAPESPLSSDETTSSFTSLQPAGAVCSATLPEVVTKRGSQSKKKKKQKAQHRKVAREEFFRPICDLFEDEDSVLAVPDLSLTDMGSVLSLTELCLIKIQQVVKTHNFEEVTVPYLFQLMITQDRILKSTAALQMRWAERNFAAMEMFYDMLLKPAVSDDLIPLAIHSRPFWKISVDAVDPMALDTSLHCPTPQSLAYDDAANIEMGILRIVLHFCDFLFPMFGATGNVLSSQIPAVYRVNHFLETRYPKVTKRCAERLKLWPAYVCWARGHVRQATDFFTEAVSTLKDKCDKAICLNELGRMMCWYGDREYSVTFFRKSLDAVLDMFEDRTLMREERLISLHHKMAQVSSFALMASAWDVGPMDMSSARGAKLAWQAVLKEYATTQVGSGMSTWYFHEAAMESQLCLHSATSADVANLNVQRERWNSSVRQWLEDCENFALQHAPNYPVLYYHLALVNALAKRPQESRKNFRSYVINFAGFQEWADGRVPGNPFGLPTPIHQRPSPWELLVNLIPDDMKTAPVLPLCWRTRLLHPYYPYSNPKEISYLADHCSEQINLHFTDDGYLTGDMCMDFPPMRCVLLDPLTGKVCFSKSSALAHYSGQLYRPEQYPAPFAPPQPLRLLKTDWCSVELVVGYTHDLTLYCTNDRPTTSCYHTMLHWYGSDGTHLKLDLRRLIRKSVKDSLLSLFHTKNGPIEDKIKRVETIIDKGLIVSWRIINSNCGLEKFPGRTINRSGHTVKLKPKKTSDTRNSAVTDFYLHMTRHCVIGANTILLTFQLDNHANSADHPDDVLVFVPCSSVDSFMNPVVHYSVDSYTMWLPDFKDVSYYCNNHLPHIRHVYTTSLLIERPPWKYMDGRTGNQKVVRHQVFDEYGKVLFSEKWNPGRAIPSPHSVSQYYNATNGNQLFKCTEGYGGLTSSIDCCSFSKPDQSLPTTALLGAAPHVFSLPGCLLVQTSTGLYALDPVTLTPLSCKMLQARDDRSNGEADDIPRPQFDIAGRTLVILNVFNIKWSSSVRTMNNNDTKSEQVADFPDSMNSPTLVAKPTGMDCQSLTNSCFVAIAINSRLLVMKISECELAVTLDVELPGMITEFHNTGGNGYLVATSVFHDRRREDVYWLSRDGRLLGVIPCLGSGPRSFCVKFLESKSTGEDYEDSSGTFAFFNDGYGGISCVKLLPP